MTITKERLLKTQHWRETYGADSNVMLPAEEAEELARIALAAPEPVVPESISVRQAISALESADCVTTIGQAYKMGWNACRAAMLQGSQPVSNRDELQVIGWLRSDYNSDDKRDPDAPLFMLGSNNPSETWGVKYMPLTGNSPVTPDGWISCSERMPAQDDWVLIYSKYGEYLAGQVQGEYVELNDGTLSWLWSALHWMPLPEPPQQ
ncbi:DUF551 domain-containing protein [Salmonella enterica]|nr:DUF551 domain-containing protein [Salmonella enterica]EGF0279321.1 DUF551 domain-containing protein [Salmonella enterica]